MKSASGNTGLIADLEQRDLIHDSTNDRGDLAALLAEAPVTLYMGFDPSADSLHLGNLLGVLMLRRFAEEGHRPIALLGGATGMVGDPSGRSSERNLLSAEVLSTNLEAIRKQVSTLLGTADIEVVDNADWTEPLSVIEFLRDVGKHVTVGQMLAKESVRARLAGDRGISYTEFSYMLLQAFDFCWLYTHKNCHLQVGGSDQWGNITVGVDLIRRRLGGTAHGLTWPLLTRSDGQKFGKTAEGTVWLDAAKTLPWDLYQYLVRSSDADVGKLLAQLTMVPMEDVHEVLHQHARDPASRMAQHFLAEQATTIVHGAEIAKKAAVAAVSLYGTASLTGEMLSVLADTVSSLVVDACELEIAEPLVELLVRSGLCSSRSDARRQLQQGAVSVNRSRASSPALRKEQWIDGRYLLLQRGKRECRVAILRSV